MHLGGCRFSWSSDYAQFFLLDADDVHTGFLESLGPAEYERRFFVANNGLVIFTADALRQEIESSQCNAPPATEERELLSETVWTHRIETKVHFSSGSFVLSSPSRANGHQFGPRFKAISPRLQVRVEWLEYDVDRYNAFRPKPDVFRITLWP